MRGALGVGRSRAGSLLATLATTGVATLLAFAINFLVTPFIAERLGAAAYGFITLASTFVGYAMIAMTALTSYATRFVAVEYHKGNKEKASSYVSTLVIAGAVASVALFVVLAVIALFIDRLMNVPQDLVADVKVLMLLVFTNFFVTTGGTFFSCSAYIKNKLDVYGVFQSVSYVVEAAVLVALYVALPPHVAYFGIGLLAAGVILTVGNVHIFRRYTPDLCVRPGLFSATDLRTLLVNGVWNSINSLGNTLHSGLDLVIVNLFLSATAMGQMAISKTFSGVFSRLFQLVSQAFQPLLLESYTKGDRPGLLAELRVSMKLSGYISNVLFAGFFALCPAFYRLWIPGQDQEVLYVLTMLTVACSAFEGPVNPLYFIYTLTVRNRVPCFATLIGGVLNVAGKFVLLSCTGLGVYGVALTTTVIMGLTNLVFNPLYMARCLGERWSLFYPSLLRIALSCAGMCVVFDLVAVVMPTGGWAGFCLAAVVCALVGAAIHYAVALDGRERRAVRSRLARKFR